MGWKEDARLAREKADMIAAGTLPLEVIEEVPEVVEVVEVVKPVVKDVKVKSKGKGRPKRTK
jgi:hypothetical protein